VQGHRGCHRYGRCCPATRNLSRRWGCRIRPHAPRKTPGNAKLHCQLGRQLLLAENKGLEGMEQVLDRQTRQGLHSAAVLVERDVVKTADLDPVTEVAIAVFGVHDRWPRYCERIHAVLVLEYVGGKHAVLAPLPGTMQS
jgi:hypothetical protein